MNKTPAIVAATGISVVALLATVQVLGSENAIMDLNPDLDSKIVRKAHRRMLRDVLLQRVNSDDLNVDDDDSMNQFFLDNYVNPLISE